MAISFYTKLGILFKKITGIKDISLMRKNLHKRIGMIFYKKKYTSKDIIEAMARMGVKPGSTLCIHASMKEFYNYQGTAIELIDAITSVGIKHIFIMCYAPRHVISIFLCLLK